jgi:hypothetical protein
MPVVTMLLPVGLAFVLASCKLFNSLRTMEVQMGVGAVLRRDESPFQYWFVILLQCLVIGALLAIIYWPLFILPNQVMS